MTGVLEKQGSGPLGTLAVVLARVVVPLWLFIGAVLKLDSLSASHLPAAIIKWAGGLGLDLMFVLRFTIAAELIVVGVMVLVPPLARWTGIVMLASFMPVLIGDLVLGSSSCGCFGAVSVSPWVTLVMDVTFFLGLVVWGRREPRLALTARLSTWRVVVAGLWILASVALSFGLRAPAPPAAGAAVSPAEAQISIPLPVDGYYLPDYEAWLGQSFLDLDLVAWVEGLPDDIASGSQYVIFYRMDCEHCHELMELYFSGSLAVPTTAIAVPEKGGFPTENVQPFACLECRVAELPAGVDWFLQTPVLVRLFDGSIECVSEVDPESPECLEL
jgi:hypothetical protein